MKHRSSSRLSEAVAASAVVAASLLLAGPSQAADTNVDLTAANQFEPATVTVTEGDTVTFTWRGGFHDVVFADGVSSGTPVGIDGTTFSRTFDTAGSYGYVCTVHESTGMVGTVIVEAGTSATTATTAPATTAPAAATPTTAAPTSTAESASAAPSAGGTSAGSTSNAAPTGGGSGGGATRAQPFTGPEQSLLPALGVALVLGGVVIRLRLRRAS